MAASRHWTRHDHGDKKYQCRAHGTGRERQVVHDPRCRASRPLCKYRRAVCRCSAAPWPHRPGSMRGCREGGIPEVLMQSRSFRQASGFGERVKAVFKRFSTRRGARK